MQLVAAPLDLAGEHLPPDDPLHVAGLAAHDTAFGGGAGREKMRNPDLGVDDIGFRAAQGWGKYVSHEGNIAVASVNIR